MVETSDLKFINVISLLLSKEVQSKGLELSTGQGISGTEVEAVQAVFIHLMDVCSRMV
jgi:hypothetical protein